MPGWIRYIPDLLREVVLVVTSFVVGEDGEGAEPTVGRESGFEVQFSSCDEF